MKNFKKKNAISFILTFFLVISMFSNGRAFANDDSSTNFWDSKYPLTTQRANVTSDGTQSQYDIGSTTSALSSDGRYVVFDSYASDLVTGDTNNTWDVFLHDNKTGTTTIVSVASDGTKGNYDSQATSMSADARYIVFQSNATNLVTGDTNSKTDIFLHENDLLDLVPFEYQINLLGN